MSKSSKMRTIWESQLAQMLDEFNSVEIPEAVRSQMITIMNKAVQTTDKALDFAASTEAKNVILERGMTSTTEENNMLRASIDDIYYALENIDDPAISEGNRKVKEAKEILLGTFAEQVRRKVEQENAYIGQLAILDGMKHTLSMTDEAIEELQDALLKHDHDRGRAILQDYLISVHLGRQSISWPDVVPGIDE